MSVNKVIITDKIIMTKEEAEAFLKKYKVKKDVYQMNYERLMPYINLMKEKKFTYLKVRNGSYMDLNIDLLDEREEFSIYSLAHNYVQSIDDSQIGDLMADPDMQIKIHWKSLMAEALTYQQDGVPIIGTIYQEVYPKPGFVNMKLKKELNQHLSLWLKNLKDQGFVKSLKSGDYTGREDEE